MKSGNSKSKIIQINNQLFFEKSFPQNNQIQFYNEYFIHNYLTNFSKMFTVPLVNKDSKNLKLLYQYMPNTKYLSKVHFIKYLNLIKSIHRSTCNKNRNNLFAKEALINNNICINQIKEKFKNHKQNKLSFDIEKEYKFFIEKLETFFLNRLVPHLEKINPKSSHLFSHADSGIHNCVLDFNNELRLVDLEYAGFDSPIKQHIDFLIHPRNLKGSEIFKDWSNYFLNEKISKDDKPNLNIYNSLFSIKWSLIIMNEFLSERWKVRIYADPSRNTNRAKILYTQLKKANLYLNASIKLLDNERFEELFSKSEIILISKSY